MPPGPYISWPVAASEGLDCLANSVHSLGDLQAQLLAGSWPHRRLKDSVEPAEKSWAQTEVLMSCASAI